MTQSNVKGTIEQMSFNFKVQNVSKLNAIFSPEFMIKGIPWKVQVAKNIIGGKSWLGAFLFCAKMDKTPNWEHVAFGKIQLVSFNENVDPITYYVRPCVYDHTGKGQGTLCLINWDDLMDVTKCYVEDDAFILNCTIEAADPNDLNKAHMICAYVEKCCDEFCWSTYRLTIGHIKKLLAVRSAELKIRNLPFRISIYKEHVKNSLGFDLHSGWNSNASCKIQATVKLISSNAEKNIKPKRTGNLQSLCVLSVKNLISWNELMMPENGFIENDCIVIKVEIKTSQLNNVHPNDAINDAKRAKLECPICFESIQQKTIASVACGHIFCTPCITNISRTTKQCPTCGKAVNASDVRPAYLPITEWA